MTVIASGVGERSWWRVAPAPGIRMRRPPSLEPLDERATATSTDSELPLDWSPPASRARRHPIGPVAPASSAVASAQRYVRTCLEVLNGFRPASHLRTLAGPVEFGAVVAQLGRRRNGCGHFPQSPSARAGRPHGHDPASPRPATTPPNASRQPAAAPAGPATHRGSFVPSGPSAPGAEWPRNASAAAQPFRVQRMRVAEPRDGVAEIVAVLSYGSASLAVAMRLERRGESWLCALAQFI